MEGFGVIMFFVRIVIVGVVAGYISLFLNSIGISRTITEFAGYSMILIGYFLSMYFIDDEALYNKLNKARQSSAVFERIYECWYMYLMPLYALIVACVHFKNYNIYYYLRYYAALQSCFYVSRLFPAKNIFKKTLALFFAVMAILFCPLFDIHMRRDTWIVFDFLIAIASILTNYFLYKYDTNKW